MRFAGKCGYLTGINGSGAGTCYPVIIANLTKETRHDNR
jgi:hypothetical protein